MYLWNSFLWLPKRQTCNSYILVLSDIWCQQQFLLEAKRTSAILRFSLALFFLLLLLLLFFFFFFILIRWLSVVFFSYNIFCTQIEFLTCLTEDVRIQKVEILCIFKNILHKQSCRFNNKILASYQRKFRKETYQWTPAESTSLYVQPCCFEFERLNKLSCTSFKHSRLLTPRINMGV